MTPKQVKNIIFDLQYVILVMYYLCHVSPHTVLCATVRGYSSVNCHQNSTFKLNLSRVIALSPNEQENFTCSTPAFSFTALGQILFLGFQMYSFGHLELLGYQLFIGNSFLVFHSFYYIMFTTIYVLAVQTMLHYAIFTVIHVAH